MPHPSLSVTPPGGAPGFRGTGERYRAPGDRPDLLQPSRDGKHVWVAAAAFRLTDEDARRVHTVGDGDVHLDPSNMASIAVGCFACEQAWEATIAGLPCPGDRTALQPIPGCAACAETTRSLQVATGNRQAVARCTEHRR